MTQFEEHDKAIQQFLKKREKVSYVAELGMDDLMKEFDHLVKRIEGLSKASKALASAYKNAISNPKNNPKALAALKKAAQEYVGLLQSANKTSSSLPRQAMNLWVEADKEYQEELDKLNALRANARRLLEKVRVDSEFIHRETSVELPAAHNLVERTEELIRNGNLEYVHQKPADEVLFKAADWK